MLTGIGVLVVADCKSSGSLLLMAGPGSEQFISLAGPAFSAALLR